MRLSIKAIRKKDRQRFTIEWSDGKLCEYLSKEVQQHCPCAHCSGGHQTRVSSEEDVEIVQIINVGRYALQIVFSHGCSKGIYTLEQMRQMGVV